MLDLPGWRGGGARSCEPTLTDVAHAVTGWLQATHRQHVVLVGHSTGAQVALRASHLAPGALCGLVLAGPTFDPAARSLGAAAVRAAATVPHESPSVAEVTLPSYLRSGAMPLLRFIRSALIDRPEDDIGEVASPVLVMAGRPDDFCPLPWATLLADRASTVCHTMGGGHMAQYSDPRAADDILQLAVRSWSG